MPSMTDEEIKQQARDLQATIGAPRARFLRRALDSVGLAFPDPRYVDWILLGCLDGATPTNVQRTQAREMAEKLSLCGLVYEDQARAAGVAWPLLFKFYGERLKVPMEQAVTAPHAFAQKVGAWVDALHWNGRAMPREADGLIMGDNTRAMARGPIAYQHMELLVLWAEGLAHSVAGGQPGIEIRTRALLPVERPGQPPELWAAHCNTETGEVPRDREGFPLVGRRIIGWISAARLPYNRPPELAEGETAENAYPDEVLRGGGAKRPLPPTLVAGAPLARRSRILWAIRSLSASMAPLATSTAATPSSRCELAEGARTGGGAGGAGGWLLCCWAIAL